MLSGSEGVWHEEMADSFRTSCWDHLALVLCALRLAVCISCPRACALLPPHPPLRCGVCALFLTQPTPSPPLLPRYQMANSAPGVGRSALSAQGGMPVAETEKVVTAPGLGVTAAVGMPDIVTAGGLTMMADKPVAAQGGKPPSEYFRFQKELRALNDKKMAAQDALSGAVTKYGTTFDALCEVQRAKNPPMYGAKVKTHEIAKQEMLNAVLKLLETVKLYDTLPRSELTVLDVM
jgi:hypothetical protein